MDDERRSLRIMPRITADTLPFWNACAEHKLVFQKCSDCGHVRWPAALICPECLSKRFSWIESKGRGKIYSYVVFHRAFHPTLSNQLPYIVASVDLAEGVRLLTDIINCDTRDVDCEKEVEVQYIDVGNSVVLPLFQLAART